MGRTENRELLLHSKRTNGNILLPQVILLLCLDTRCLHAFLAFHPDFRFPELVISLRLSHLFTVLYIFGYFTFSHSFHCIEYSVFLLSSLLSFLQ